MSKRENQSYWRYLTAYRTVEGAEFIMDAFPLEKPREVEKAARALACKYPGGTMDRVLLNELAAKAQSYADVHERAEQERKRQGATS